MDKKPKIPDEAVEAAVNAIGRASNPKWDHPIFGYQTFDEDQKEYLRDRARIYLEAAAPYMIAHAREDVPALVAEVRRLKAIENNVHHNLAERKQKLLEIKEDQKRCIDNGWDEGLERLEHEYSRVYDQINILQKTLEVGDD